MLIVGYDDNMQAVAIVDPWNNSWGGTLGGRRWLSYSHLQVMAMNCTCDKQQNMTPLQLDIESDVDRSRNLSLQLRVGFYTPRGAIMDRASWAIRSLCIECLLPSEYAAEAVTYSVSGNWHVGDSICLSLPLAHGPTLDGEITTRVSATIQGNRPYEFEDVIEISKTTPIKNSEIGIHSNLTSHVSAVSCY